MFKSSIVSVRYQDYFKGSLMPYKALLLLIIPFAAVALIGIFQVEIAAWLQELLALGSAYGLAYYQDLVTLVATEILWICFFLLLFWVLMVLPSREALERTLAFSARSANDHMVMLILFVFFVVTLYVSFNTLERFPVSANEYAYLLQAEMFSHGKFWEPAHDLPGFFYHQHLVQHDGILVSRFPPGWPLFLSAAFETGIAPFLVNPVIAVVTLVVFYFFARWMYGPQTAMWSLIAVAFTGYFVFTSASYFSHVLSLLLALAFVSAVHLYGRDQRIIYGLIAGFFLGLTGLTRHYTALLIFLPFLVYIAMRYGKTSWRLILTLMVGASPALVFLLSYNYAITGDPLLPVQLWAFPGEKLGFADGHSWMRGVEHVFGWIALLMYWAAPGLIVLYLVFIKRKLTSAGERFAHPEDYILILLMAGHLFYYGFGGHQYGPRFLFEGFPFLVLFVVNKVLQAREKWAMALLLASLMYAIVKFPVISNREEQIVDERQDLFDLVEEQNIRNAVVLVSGATSPIRPMTPSQLTRNDPKFLNPVIYALELPEISGQLMEFYPDRAFYRYTRNADETQGSLVRIK